MARNFAALAFTAEVKALQERHGSRSSYARMEKHTYVDGLTENEIDFISQRDSFYMASIGDNHFPYIQHRGGPKGFIKVLDANRIGLIDFTGNRQYISVGNITTNKNVALIMVDYPSKARLKILARVEIVELNEDPSLFQLLALEDYKYKPERMMVFTIEAYDWDCPQHITPRYTIAEIEQAFLPLKEKIVQQEEEIKFLKEKLSLKK